MERNVKEVNFNLYCNGGVRKDGKKVTRCAFFEVKEWEEPCNSCLCMGSRLNTEKPINYKEGK